MPEKVPFIGREDELDLIDDLIEEWGTRKVILIQGEGGIGKTRLLQEVRARFAGAEEPHPVLVPQIIDFGRPEMRTAVGMGLAIADSMGRRAFGAYLKSLSDWRRISRARVSPERLRQEKRSVADSFAECFGAVSAKRRVVLLIDTVDVLTERDRGNIGFVSYLENILVLIAGRKAENLEKALPPDVSGAVQVVSLSPFREEDSAEYLRRKQEILHTTLEENLAAKILLLAEGRPIMIDLAVEWVAHEIPVNWLVKESLDKLRRLPEDELRARCRDFEYRLVHHIARRRTSQDHLFLVLAQVGSLGVGGIAQLLGLSIEEANTLWNRVQEFSVVKSAPDGRIALHDEMRRMINEYVWPEIDPAGARLRRDSKKAAAYFAEEAANVQRKLDEFKRKQEVNDIQESVSQEWDVFWQREALERRFWMYARQQLSLTNRVDLSEGIELFVQFFDLATRSYNLQVRQDLIDEILAYIGQLPPEHKYKLDICIAKHLHDQADYLGETALLLELLRTEDLEPDLQIEALIQLGNAEIMRGNLAAGNAHFGEAIQLSQQHKLIGQLVRAKTALGWGYRLIGQRDQATTHYRDALQIALDTGDNRSQALLLNNLGYLYACRGNRIAALQLCQQALDIWEQLDDERGIGTVYGTIATILPQFNQFEEALSYRQKALDIFEPMGDLENERLSSNYCMRGVNHWLLGDLDSAREDLERAQEIGMNHEQHIILHHLAHVHMDLGDTGKALELLEKSQTISQSLPDPLYELHNLGGMAEIARYQRQFSRWREFENEIKSYRSKWAMVEYDLPEGLLWKCLGDLACGDGQFDKAIEFYQQGLRLIASAGSYEPYTISTQLRKTEQLFRENPAYLPKLGQTLMQFWLDQQLDREHPEALFFFARWQHQAEGEPAV